MTGPAVPPVAAIRPHRVESPQGTREDPYYWLRDDRREDAEVIAHLAAENAWTDAVMAPWRPLQERIYQEIIGRIRQDDASVPWHKNGWWYYTRFETGANYPIYARRAGNMQAPEQVLLDVSAMAAPHDFFQVGSWEVSPDNRLLAWTEDSIGRRQFVIRVKDLATGELLPDVIANAEAGVVWAADSRTLLYVAKDPVTLLGDTVCRHVLGTDAATDLRLYRQADPAFYTGIGRTKDDRYLLIVSSSTVSTEYQVAAADDPVHRRRHRPQHQGLDRRLARTQHPEAEPDPGGIRRHRQRLVGVGGHDGVGELVLRRVQIDDGGRIRELNEAGKTAMFVGVDGRLAGLVVVADPVKESAAKARAKRERTAFFPMRKTA